MTKSWWFNCQCTRHKIRRFWVQILVRKKLHVLRSKNAVSKFLSILVVGAFIVGCRGASQLGGFSSRDPTKGIRLISLRVTKLPQRYITSVVQIIISSIILLPSFFLFFLCLFTQVDKSCDSQVDKRKKVNFGGGEILAPVIWRHSSMSWPLDHCGAPVCEHIVK